MRSAKGGKCERRASFSSKVKSKKLGKVTRRKADAKPEGDMGLPVEQGLVLHDALWAKEIVRGADVEWAKGDDLEASAKKLCSWKAKHDPNEKKCSLEHKFKTDETKRIDFSESQISESGNAATCKLKGADDKLPVPEGLDELEKDTLNEGYEVINAKVTWEKGGPLALLVKSSHSSSTLEAADEGNFVDLELTCDNLKGVVTFVCKLDGRKEHDLWLSGDKVKEGGLGIEFSGCREQPAGG